MKTLELRVGEAFTIAGNTITVVHSGRHGQNGVEKDTFTLEVDGPDELDATEPVRE